MAAKSLLVMPAKAGILYAAVSPLKH